MPAALDTPLLLAQADAISGWSDKEVLLRVLAAVGGTVAVVVPVNWGLVKLLCQKAEVRAAEFASENAKLRSPVAGQTGEDLTDLRARLDEGA